MPETRLRTTTVFHVPLADVRPNPKNPRRQLASLDGLADSIREFGVLVPVTGTASGRIVTLIMGGRRLAASKMAGRETIPVILTEREGEDRTLAKALVENVHHSPMTPLDEGRACQEFVADGYSVPEIAELLSHSPAWVTGRLALLELPQEMQAQLAVGAIGLGPAVTAAKLVQSRRSGVVGLNDRAPRTLVKTHPLSPSAAQHCDQAGHPRRGRVGPACGQCWEDVIRADERAGRSADAVDLRQEPALSA